jgi:hypothetical protein
MINENTYIIVRKFNFFIALIIGVIVLILGGLYLSSSPEVGIFLLGFGLGICILLIEQKITSMGRYKV